jgi:hypothetical protein
MSRILTVLGASTIALGAMIGNAVAWKKSYEINGQRYSYESNDPQQVAAARKRIEAADAADAAKAKADAERAANPLVAIFGSQVQRDSTAAQERLRQVLSEQGPAAAATKRRRGQQAAGQERIKNQIEESASANATTELPNPQNAPKPDVKSVYIDAASGIKTTFMADGSIHEEMFDSTVLSTSGSGQAPAADATGWLDELRKAQPVVTTGSTAPLSAESQSRPRN